MIENSGIKNITSAKLSERCSLELGKAKEFLQKVLSVTTPRNEENTLVPFNELNIHLSNATCLAGVYAHLHPEKEVRSTAEKMEQEIQKFATSLSLHQDLYHAIREIDTTQIGEEEKRLVTKTLLDFHRSGVDKEDSVREEIKNLQEQMHKIGQEFSRNIREDVRSIELSQENQLEGLPKDYIDAHPEGPEKTITITTDYPDYLPFMKYAKDKEAKRSLCSAFRNRAYPQNEEVLHNLLKTRHKLANLLGYNTWADYILEDKMVKNPEKVQSFIQDITEMSRVKAKQEYALLQEVKREAEKEENAYLVENWESAYYTNKLKAEKFLFDPLSVRPYFQYEKVKDGIMNLSSEIFSVRFEKIHEPEIWHDSVEVYNVFDQELDEHLGRIYLDMHPREGKFKHAAQTGLKQGVQGRQLPEGVLMCNFPDPGEEKAPALMEHDQVKTFFHEFGHLLHHILGGKQKWIRFSGVATEWDFVEAPSQLLEEWVMDHQVLERFASHYETGEKIPEELVNRMKDADEFGKGIFVRQQMFYATLSLRYHNEDPSNFNLTQLMKDTEREYSPFPHMKGTHFHLSFGHLDGYSAIYYTYAWSHVIAKDLFSRFQKSGILDETVCREYRSLVLEPGGAQDAADLVKAFLKRPYSFEAYKEWITASSKESYFPSHRVL